MKTASHESFLVIAQLCFEYLKNLDKNHGNLWILKSGLGILSSFSSDPIELKKSWHIWQTLCLKYKELVFYIVHQPFI